MPHFPFTGRKPGEPESPASAQSAAPGAAPEEKTATQPEAGTEQKDGEITGRMKWVANPLKSGWDALSDKMPPKEKVEEKMDRAGSFLKKQAGILAANLPRREDFSEAFSRAGEKAREGFRAVSGKIRSAGAKNGEEQSGPSLRERVDELRDILYIKRKKSRPEEKDVPGTPGTSADRTMKAGSVGPRWMFFTPRCSRARSTIPAFCSYQAILKKIGRSLMSLAPKISFSFNATTAQE